MRLYYTMPRSNVHVTAVDGPLSLLFVLPTLLLQLQNSAARSLESRLESSSPSLALEPLATQSRSLVELLGAVLGANLLVSCYTVNHAHGDCSSRS